MTLEEIVRAFASEEPLRHDRDGDSECYYCGAYRGHEEECAWRAAKLFADNGLFISNSADAPEGGTWVEVTT